MAERWREYRYRSMFRATRAEYEEMSASDCDWLLAMADIEAKAQQSLMEKQSHDR